VRVGIGTNKGAGIDEGKFVPLGAFRGVAVWRQPSLHSTRLLWTVTV
jgi:hypothetical protein